MAILLIVLLIGIFITIVKSFKSKQVANMQQLPRRITKQNQGHWNSGFTLIIIGVLILIATLPFHYIPDRSMVFPKENLTFSNTIITEDDIVRLIVRYNNASLFEQQAIMQEPLHRKLIENGVIVNEEKTSSEDFDDENRYSTTTNKLDFLKAFGEKYPYDVKLFDNLEFTQRLKKLIGDSQYDIVEVCSVETPIELSDNVFISTGCKAHDCGSTRYIIVYDFSTNVMQVGIQDDGEVEIYSENGQYLERIRDFARY
ncbi:MAG: hypothetical protein EZS26_001379 [Candidatus Ordinivivax streblomastigis]|uniref:Uncharacterized protein n=1 Tax=Candidatus Ordinivivax streblomastigis TaxID=2540710 RepID=A0A5M8P256_9BACT|nr:MAG: hypothetical protein EZS26_001379 [Candidatus Ordinivivax streblomastigis]